MGISFCNGQFIDENEPCIPLTDRGFLFGDAIFTSIKVVNGIPQLVEAHFTRLKTQCEALRIVPPELTLTDIDHLILKNMATQGVWRLKMIITGGNEPSLNLQKRKFGKFLMTMSEVHQNIPDNFRLTVFPMPICKPTARLKSLSYLDRLFVMDYAISHGFDDAIVLSVEGFLLETAFSNIFWINGPDVYIPDPNLDLMMGVTLTDHIEVLKNSGHTIHYVKQRLEDIAPSSQIFICNSIKEIVRGFIIS